MPPPVPTGPDAAHRRPPALFGDRSRPNALRLALTLSLVAWCLAGGGVSGSAAAGAPAVSRIAFHIPAQAADRALLAFAKQAGAAILFSTDELQHVRCTAVSGLYEPAEAVALLLQGTGYTARQTGPGKWVVRPTGPPMGSVKGQLLAPDGSPARRVRVQLVPGSPETRTKDTGEFEFRNLLPGLYSLNATAGDNRPLVIEGIKVVAAEVTQLEPASFHVQDEATRMEPFLVQARATQASTLDHSETRGLRRVAGGNLDLGRTESDALPYMIFNRSQIARSGVVNLNEFLQRELIDTGARILPPEQDPAADLYDTGSSNLSLRGYDADETVILVNGRRMPEVMTTLGGGSAAPDVNFIPLSLVQQIEVLPVSASALYSGNAVGGVINIVLRPDVDTRSTEINATYTNALRGFDAPQKALSLLHAESLLGEALRFRFNATWSHTVPPTESELGYRQRRARARPVGPDNALFGATPNVRAETGALFGPGTAAVTSVAPGADGRGGRAAFQGREGVRNPSFFDSAAHFSTGPASLDFPYGREQQAFSAFTSAVYDVTPWLQLAADAMMSRTTMHRGLESMQHELSLGADSAFNPFGVPVKVTLNETAPALGSRYRESRLDFGSFVAGALIRLPYDWKIALDGQYSRNTVLYRGLVGASTDRWQALVDAGKYNPLRDTQVFGAPPEFYDQVLIYHGRRGEFGQIGAYSALDGAVRLTHEAVALPTGPGILNLGTDYRRNRLAAFVQERRYGDGTLDGAPVRWGSRTLQRYSFFGELQAPLIPLHRLPQWLTAAETDLALRYVAADTAKEANFAPTYAAKLAFRGGISLRGSITTSSRYPTPRMTRPIVLPDDGGGTAPVNLERVEDYRRGEGYDVVVNEVPNPDLQPETALTQTAGILFERGRQHRWRAALDYVATHKTNEELFLTPNTITLNEAYWPERLLRQAPAPGETIGRIRTVFTGRTNLSNRQSQNWTGSFDYRGREVWGGTLEAYARVLYFQKYQVRVLPQQPVIDELDAPEGVVPLLKYRANLGASWSTKTFSVGADGHYFHSRVLPVRERTLQGRSTIKPYWQADVFVGVDLARWLPWQSRDHGLRAQVRVNNVLGIDFPKYMHDPYDAGVQNYGDWRGRVYSLSLTANF